jgi:hypothetical protein
MLSVGDAAAQIILPQTIEANTTDEAPVYVDKINGLSMEYPSNWTKIESIEDVVFVAPPQRGAARLTLVVEHSNATLDELATSYISLYESVDNFKIGAPSTIDFKGHHAWMLTFTSTSSNSTPQNNILILITLEDNKYAKITYDANPESYPLYLPVVQKMIDSIEILPTSAPLQAPVISDITNSGNFSKLEDLYHGIRMEFPSDWNSWLLHTPISGSSVKEIVAFVPPDVNESNPFLFTVGVENLGSSDISLEDYTTAKLSTMGQDNIVEEKTTSVSGYPSYQVVHTDEGFTGMQVWTVVGDKVFVISIMPSPAFNSYLPVVQKMIDSIEILPTSAPLQAPVISDITNSSEFVTYENATNGIKIDHPSDWVVSEESKKLSDESTCHILIQCTINRVEFTSPEEGFSDRLRENLVVISGLFAGGVTLDQMVEIFSVNIDQTQKGYTPIESKPIHLKDNSSAHMNVYQFIDSNNQVISAIDVYTLKGKAAYVIKAIIEPAKYSDYLPVVQRMINSIEILPTSAPLQSPSITNITNSSEFVTYENATNGIKIDHPSDWVVNEIELPPDFRKYVFAIGFISQPDSSIDQFRERIMIKTEYPLEENTTFDDILLQESDYIRKSPHNQNITITEDKLGDIPATMISYLQIDGEEKIQHVELYAKRYDRLYTVILLAHPSEFNEIYLPVLRQMINSFEIPFITFSDRTAGISVGYPFDYLSIEGSVDDFVSTLGSSYNKSFYFVSPDFEEFIHVLIENLPSTNIALDDYANTAISLLREEPSVEIIESVRTELSGLNAQKITYTYSLNGTDTKETQFITMSQDKAYSLQYSAPSSRYSDNTLRKLHESFTIYE